ncbi:MAG: hypothetical protein ACJ75Z_02150 [Solirubrobacterales bacterium]
MRRRPSILRVAIASAAIGVALLVGGCGNSQNDEAPAACLATPNGYLQALRSAPGPVVLQGGVTISDCLVPEQSGGQLASIGQSMVVAATRLNLAARRDPGGPPTVQLGYLIGAVSKGADAIHTDLVRRLNSAARFTESGGTPPASFERAFGRGYAAGHQSG